MIHRLRLATLLVAMIPGVSAACSCVERLSSREASKGSASVFVGRVTAMLPPEHDADFRMPLQAVTFAVSRRIKGVDGALIRIETPVHDASCGIHFDVGRDYLVYAHGTPARLFATLCSRTREAAGAEDEIEALGGGI